MSDDEKRQTDPDLRCEYEGEDGVRVVITNARFFCPTCRDGKGRWAAASEFGKLRRTSDGVIRNQTRCKKCR